jgi:hypothetical protein
MDSPTRLKIDALIRYGALGILSQEEVVSRSRAILEEFDNPSQGVRGDASMQPDVEARVALMCVVPFGGVPAEGSGVGAGVAAEGSGVGAGTVAEGSDHLAVAEVGFEAGGDGEMVGTTRARKSHTWTPEFVADTLEIGKAHMKHTGYHFKYGDLNKGYSAYSCIVHKDCRAMLRMVQVTRTSTWSVQTNGVAHTQELAKGKGVFVLLRPVILNMHKAGAGPMKIMSILKTDARYRSDPMVVALEVNQVRNFCRGRRKVLAGAFKLLNTADMEEWVAANSMPVDPVEAMNMDGTKLIVMKEGYRRDVVGFAFSCIDLLKNIGELERAGYYPSLECDGTYKIDIGGWALITVGSHVLKYDPRSRKVVQSFLPIAYAFVKTEVEESFTLLFNALRVTSCFLGLGDVLPVSVTGDRCRAMINAAKVEWPLTQITTCWPHIARKAGGEKRGILKSQDHARECAQYLECLHQSRSQEQFDAAGVVVVKLLRELGEDAYATWLDVQYLTPPYNVWFVTVSGFPGVSPTSNPQESYHSLLKKHSGLQLRAATDVVLESTLPDILFLTAGTKSGPISTEPRPVQSDLVEKAHELKTKGVKGFVVHEEVLYCNAGGADQKVSKRRIDVYKRGLAGDLAAASYEELERKFYSLYACRRQPAEGWPAVAGGYRCLRNSLFWCDCEDFWQSKVCSHTLLYKDLVEEEGELALLMAPLPKNGRRGRKKRVTSALRRMSNG